MFLVEYHKSHGVYEVKEFSDDTIKMRPDAFLRTVRIGKNLPPLRYGAVFSNENMPKLEAVWIRRIGTGTVLKGACDAESFVDDRET